MPRLPKKTKFNRKRRATTARKPRAKSTRRPRRAGISRTMDHTKPMPSQLNTKFRYVSDQKQFITGVAGVPVEVFRLNSLFDPEFTGVGHQPLNWDQITPFYQFYRVNGVKVIIRFFGSPNDGMRVGYKARNSTDSYNTALRTCSQIRETQNTRIKIVNSDSPARDGVVSHYFPLSRLQGISRLKFNIDDTYTATTVTNPVNSMFLDVFASGPVDNSAGFSINYTVELIYYTTMFGLITQGQS